MEEYIDVVKLNYEGRNCLFLLDRDKNNIIPSKNLLEEINLFITESDGDCKITLEKTKMLKSEYENVPEFEGW